MEFWVEIQGSYFYIGMEFSNETCFFQGEREIRAQRENDS